MHLPENAELLRIFIGDSDRYHHKPLYEAIVETAREHHLAGATVLRGYLGFGAHSHIHTAQILGTKALMTLPDIEQVLVGRPWGMGDDDYERRLFLARNEIEDRAAADKIEAFLPVVDAMMAEGMVTVEPVRVLTYRHDDGSGES